jgi:hypothetical protein
MFVMHIKITVYSVLDNVYLEDNRYLCWKTLYETRFSVEYDSNTWLGES